MAKKGEKLDTLDAITKNHRNGIRCPHNDCGGKSVRNGLSPAGKQVYRCKDCRRSFIPTKRNIYIRNEAFQLYNQFLNSKIVGLEAFAEIAARPPSTLYKHFRLLDSNFYLTKMLTLNLFTHLAKQVDSITNTLIRIESDGNGFNVLLLATDKHQKAVEKKCIYHLSVLVGTKSSFRFSVERVAEAGCEVMSTQTYPYNNYNWLDAKSLSEMGKSLRKALRKKNQSKFR